MRVRCKLSNSWINYKKYSTNPFRKIYLARRFRSWMLMKRWSMLGHKYICITIGDDGPSITNDKEKNCLFTPTIITFLVEIFLQVSCISDLCNEFSSEVSTSVSKRHMMIIAVRANKIVLTLSQKENFPFSCINIFFSKGKEIKRKMFSNVISGHKKSFVFVLFMRSS